MTMDEKLIKELEERLKIAVHLDEPKRTKEFNSILTWLKDETLINNVKTIKKRIDESREIEVPGMSKDEVIKYSNLFAQRCYKFLPYNDFEKYIEDDFKRLDFNFYFIEFPSSESRSLNDFKSIYLYEEKKKELNNYKYFLMQYKPSLFWKRQSNTSLSDYLDERTNEWSGSIFDKAPLNNLQIESIKNPLTAENFELFKYIDEHLTNDIIKKEKAKYSYIYNALKDKQSILSQKDYFTFISHYKNIKITNRVQPSANNHVITRKIKNLIDDFENKKSLKS
jgi:hypothetical protein